MKTMTDYESEAPKASLFVVESEFLAAAWGRLLSYAGEFEGEEEAVVTAVRLKVEHTACVRRHCRDLATHLGLPPREIFLAELAGLLHDVGRFRQFKIYHTFRDADSADHAALGLETIAEKNLLAGLPPDEQELVTFAIANHNKKTAAHTDDPRKERHAKILRDADKLDIYRLLQPPGGEVSETEALVRKYFYTSDDMRVGEAVAGRLISGEQCDFREVRTAGERLVMRLIWLYDVNYAWTLERITAAGHVDYVLEKLAPLDKNVALGIEKLHNYICDKLRS